MGAIARLQNGGAAIDIKNQMADINAQMSKIKATEDANYTKAVSDLVTERTHAVNAKFSSRNSLDMALSNKKRYQGELDTNIKERDALRKKYSETAEQTFECSVESVCPACGQDLPESKVEEARGKAIAEFNTNKAGILESINRQGKQFKARAEELEKLIAGLDAQIPGYEKAVVDADTKISELESKLTELKNCIRTYGPECSKLAEEYNSLQAKLSETTVPMDEIMKLDSEKAVWESRRSEIARDLANRDSNKRLDARIGELKEEQKTISAEYGNLERQEDLLTQFVKAQVNAIEANVNGKFQITRFKMFDMQINGGMAECCEAMVNGVPYGNINQAAKTNCGLDIINTLSKHYGITAPIFIDRCESVTKLLPTEAQTICLYVSEADKKLRIEGRE
jgi:chromosome segregation ATPase